MVPIHRDMTTAAMTGMSRDTAAHSGNQHSTPINQIFPYLIANGEDQVAELIRLYCEIWRHSSLENFSCELKLHAHTSTVSIRSSTNNLLGWGRYYFDIGWEECYFDMASPERKYPEYLQVRLTPPPHPNSRPGVQVAYSGHWLSIPDFLEHYPRACARRAWTLRQTPTSLYSSQFTWWQALSNLPTFNPQRKVVRLMRLPAEIRENIYRFVFPAPFRPFPGAKCRRLGGISRIAFMAAQPNASLLKLNHKVHQEVTRVLFRDTIWDIPHLKLLRRILVSEALCARVQRLHLALSHGEYLRIFAVKSEFNIASLRPLRTMRLRELLLEFQAPSSWTTFEGGIMRKVVGCQKVMVDWLFEAMEFWVVGHEGVRIVGWVKDGQKKLIEEVCKKGLKEFRKWKEISGKEDAELGEWDEWREGMWMEEDGGVKLIENVENGDTNKNVAESCGEEAMEERTLVDHEGPDPPECFCKGSCEAEGWSAASAWSAA